MTAAALATSPLGRTFGAHEAYVGLTHEIEDDFEVAFLMFHGVTGGTQRIQAAARRRDDDGFAVSKTYRAFVGLGKRAAHLRNPVYPCFS